MSILEKDKGDTSGTLVCPNCRKWIYLVADTFDDQTKELNKGKGLLLA